MRSSALDLCTALGHEELVIVHDRASGLHAVIAIHDTTLGPAAGGTRMRAYPSLDAAAEDALRLARAMTGKAAMAEMSYGGGKAVILGDPARDKSPRLLTAYASVLDRLGGRFITAGDMGIDGDDVVFLATQTRHVTHSPLGSEVDAASLAALGTLEGVRAAARFLGRDLAGLRVVVQGLGAVGGRLARLLSAEGARLVVSDLDPQRVRQAQDQLGAVAVPPDAVYDQDTDVFSPNAAGSVLDDHTIPRLRCRAVVGAANEQLAEPRHGDLLHERGVLYAPDYLVNAGGLIGLLHETGQLDRDGVIARARGIGPRLTGLLERARAEGLAPHHLADRIVEERLAAGRAARNQPGHGKSA